ncbi:MAG: protein-L-isoaspartate O-methyltransferase [Pseudorhodoplanes sp.]
MAAYSAARRMMVDGQIRTADVTDRRILGAFEEIPRERFVPAQRAPIAYLDTNVIVSAEGATPVRRLLTPMVLARLIQAAAVTDNDRVLVVGCATGYAAAILARLAGSVIALEEDAALARHAERTLADLSVANAEVVQGPLVGGVPGRAPFDVILFDGAIEILPPALAGQVAEGGRLVAVQGRPPALQAMLYVCADRDLTGRPVFDAAAPALPGFQKAPEFVF